MKKSRFAGRATMLFRINEIYFLFGTNEFKSTCSHSVARNRRDGATKSKMI